MTKVSNDVVLPKKTFLFPLYHQISCIFLNTFMQGREPYLYIKCNFKNIFLPARETILRLLVEENFVSWVSVSLERLSSSLKLITRSLGSGSRDPGISLRLKFSEPFMSWSLIYTNINIYLEMDLTVEFILFLLNEQLVREMVFKQYHSQISRYFQDLSSNLDIRDVWGPKYNTYTDQI